jgi:hypothetical protein|tara:strand:- start:9716 stop:10360 length:645 start_codon:yes stop_codon:yes gene_type:complete
MKFEFTQKYTFPVTIESAVVTYLDCEHYIFLHRSHEVSYKIISITNEKCISEIMYKSGIFKWTQTSTTEYINKNEFKQYDIKIRGFGPAFLANFINVETSLKYYKNNKNQFVGDIDNNFKDIYINKDNDTVISEIKYHLDLPFVLYPFKNFLRKKLKKMKEQKDLEDLFMIRRRIKLFGTDEVDKDSRYWQAYFRKSYFLLFKDSFIKNFFQIL